jgi:HPt (histidine-containing phosphotransfer) domain-containing protein
MTAHSLVGEQELCYKIGMNAYVPKPFKQEQLLEAIKTVITKDVDPIQKRIIDFSFIDAVSSGEANFRKDMIDLFLEKIPNEVIELSEAIPNNDYNTAMRICHNMKSSLDIFMLKDLSNYLSTIEKEAKLEQFNSETIDKIKALDYEITEVFKILKELR